LHDLGSDIVGTVEFGDAARAALSAREIWYLATVGPDGAPQVTPVWADLREGRILVNTAAGRKKARNMGGDPRVALSWANDANLPENVSIKGRVAEWYEGERAEADADALAVKYVGEGAVFPRRAGERRLSFLIEPLHVTHLPG